MRATTFTFFSADVSTSSCSELTVIEPPEASVGVGGSMGGDASSIATNFTPCAAVTAAPPVGTPSMMGVLESWVALGRGVRAGHKKNTGSYDLTVSL